MARPPVLLAPGVWRLPTFGSDAINSYAFLNESGSITLVDAGLRGSTKRLVRQLELLGKAPADVDRILVTHAHFDHVGGLRKLQKATGGRVTAHEIDAPFVRKGHAPPIDKRKPLGIVMGLAASRFPRCDVDETFADGDVLDVGGGVTVLHTPGHSPGHSSFLHKPSGVLITGDALFNITNRIAYSAAMFCTDFVQARVTAERLGDADYETAAFTHGPEIRTAARAKVREFLQRQKKKKA